MAKRTALYDMHVALGGRMVDFAGYELPVQYSGILEEHRAVRTAAGVFDVSHMGEFLFEGKGAESALNALVTNDISSMPDGRVRYALFANERGGAVDDVLVYRVNGEKFLVVVNGANVDKDRVWAEAHLGGDCAFSDVSEKVSQLALQGPRAEDILRALSPAGELPAKYYTFTQGVKICGAEVLVSRTGYTGEDGFELYCADADAPALYRAVLEAGMPLYGHELGEDIPVDETGLDFAVRTDKENFVGRDAILAHVPAYGRVGARVAGKGIVREHCKVYADGEEVGESTSGTHSPTLGVGICMLRLKRGVTGALYADVRGRQIPLEITPLPFVKKKR